MWGVPIAPKKKEKNIKLTLSEDSTIVVAKATIQTSRATARTNLRLGVPV